MKCSQQPRHFEYRHPDHGLIAYGWINDGVVHMHNVHGQRYRVEEKYTAMWVTLDGQEIRLPRVDLPRVDLEPAT